MCALEVLTKACQEAGRLKGKFRIERRFDEHIVQKWIPEEDRWRDVLHCTRADLAEDYLLRKLSRIEGGGVWDCRFRIG